MEKLPDIRVRDWDTYNLSEDSELDRFHLDEAAERQSEYMDKWLDLLNQAQSILADAKRHLNFTESQLYLDALQGGLTGIKSSRTGAPTDGAIKAWIQTQPKYRAALEAKDKAESDVSRLQNAKTTLEHKKSMIKVCSDLWICGYFARPHIPNGARQQAEEQQREVVKERLKESLDKRKRREAEEN